MAEKKKNNCGSTSFQETFSTYYYVIHYYLGYNREKMDQYQKILTLV